MCQPLLTMKTTVIPCDPKIRYNQKFCLIQLPNIFQPYFVLCNLFI